MKFRKLNSNEIDVRIGTVSENSYTLLLYKDARCDMNILDETLGTENWQRDHKEIKGNLYCGVGIWDKEKSQWIWKWDCGTESNTEKEKGEASDSFKRACVNIGIGRELYTSPVIRVACACEKVGNAYKLPNTEKWRKFSVKEIGYNDNGEITKLIIVDDKGVQVFPKTNNETQPTKTIEEKKKSQYSGLKCEDCDEDISDKVAKYSKDIYGKCLCFNCQKSYKQKDVEV